jgi:TonB-linked SusC/RagA family outer membrane protein
MKKNFKNDWLDKHCFYKMLFIMKFTLFFMILGIMNIFALNSYSQSGKVSLNLKNAKIEDVLNQIEKSSEYYFAYNQKLINVNRKVDVIAKNKAIKDVLHDLFKNTNTDYVVINRQIVLSPKQITEEEISDIQQQKKGIAITGYVTDAKTGESLPGVSVLIKGTTKAAITDGQGKFSLTVTDPNSILSFSFIGYDGQDIKLSGKTSITVSLVSNVKNLDEVVIVGYGTQKKRELIGSISTINSDRFAKGSGSSNFTDLIQGQAAGVNVQSTSGVPGSESQISIRGHSSINAGVEPLWIIDGIPIITGSGLNNAGTTDQSPMSLINPNDIESMEVLKDAAATSIYGSRGSNGVILVTTKSGKTGKASVNVDYSTGISNLPFHKVEYLNTSQWLSIMDEAAKDNGQGSFQMTDHYSKIPYSKVFLTRDQAEKINTNWFDETMRQGEFQNLNLSVVGGNEKSSYYVSGNYRDDQSVMKGNDLQRYTLRSNIDLKPLNNLSVGVKMSLTLSKNDRVKNSTDF